LQQLAVPVPEIKDTGSSSSYFWAGLKFVKRHYEIISKFSLPTLIQVQIFSPTLYSQTFQFAFFHWDVRRFTVTIREKGKNCDSSTSIEMSPSREAASCEDIQEHSSILRNPTCSLEHLSGPCPEPDQSTSYHSIIPLQDKF
jgi:hypothetical protein